MRFKLLLSVAGACLFWFAAFLVHGAGKAAPASFFEPPVSAPPEEPPSVRTLDRTGPVIQLALLLDVSGSMDGLIEQAKSQLWSVVNRLSEATRDGVRPALETALYTYGDAGGRREIRRVLPFTTDLDLLSEKLFALRTSGSFEAAGEVILRSVRELAWDDADDAIGLLVIAGNEDFSQGEVDYRRAVRSATERRIVVSTVLCGADAAVAHDWMEAARLGGGRFLTINHNQRLADLELAAPQDAELAELGRKLNDTYIPYGAMGARGVARQQAQDANSRGLSLSNMASRARSKASALYDNSSWDLVDAFSTSRGSQLDASQLPEELRALDAEKREAYIAGKAAEREALRKRIQALSEAREAFLAAEWRRRGGRQELSLATAILEIARAQGLTFPAQG